MTKTQSATKKKLPGWAIALIVIGTILVVLGVAVGIFFLIPTDNRVTVPAGQVDAAFNVNGYQQKVDVNDLKLNDIEGAKIVSIKEMLEATGLDINNPADKAQIASNIYNMSVRNFAAINGTAYAVLTDASVYAEQVNGLGMHMDYFDVGIRSTYSQMNGPNGFFSQTISGVTKLDLEGALKPIGDKLKGFFGYNIQNFSNSKIDAWRQASNGGATFLSEEEGSYKYILGATKKKGTEFPSEAKNKKGSMFTIRAKQPSTGEAGENTLFKGNQWDPLPDNKIGQTAETQYGEVYDLGDYGAGWAKYNFGADFLDATKTTVEYDAKGDVYTLTLAVKEDKIDEACKYAKGDLIKDTMGYVQLQKAKYTKLENTIQVFGNGLIRSWSREEVMGSKLPAVLTVFPGSCKGGGETGNKALTVFSYDERDYNAERLCALYWTELGDSAVVDKLVKGGTLDLSKYPTLDNYQPDVWGKPYNPKNNPAKK